MKYPPFCWHRSYKLWWFRVFGIGLHWKDSRHHEPTFAERCGTMGKIRLGAWAFMVLTPDGSWPRLKFPR